MRKTRYVVCEPARKGCWPILRLRAKGGERPEVSGMWQKRGKCCSASRGSLSATTLGVRHKSSQQSPSRVFRTFCNDVRAPTASQIGARGEMRELESTAASRARGVPVLAAPLHNACPGASRNAAIPSFVLAQQMRAAQQGQHQRCTACTAQHIICRRARACGIASSMCIQTLCDLVK